jgi:hypothetical protein
MRFIVSIIKIIFTIAVLALLLTLAIGPLVYLELAGTNAPGIVVGKRETTELAKGRHSTQLGMEWTRRLIADVRYQPINTSTPATTQITIDLPTYERLQVGDAVQVRYLTDPILQLFAGARLSSQPPFGTLIAGLAASELNFFVGVGIWLALLGLWSLWSKRGLLVLLAAGMICGVAYLLIGPLPPAPPGPLVGADATVRAVRLFTHTAGNGRMEVSPLPQPYQIAELVFTSPGAAEPVVALDTVDADSVPNLLPGASVAIHFSATNPRWARINGATRTYAWKNLMELGVITVVVLVLGVIPWLVMRHRNVKRGNVKRGA